MVAEASQRVVGDGRIGQVVGEVADLQHLPFPAQEFDLVIANHMLYHLPDPRLGVAELARVVRPGGRVVVATNGMRHMRELWQIRADVFGTPEVDQTLDVFSAEIGFPLLRDHFRVVTWHQYDDELRCTEPADVLAYLCSTPPGEDASESQRARLDELVEERFRAGHGTFMITKDSGCFTCSEPR
jgi:SAM-dependent methyltransferase